MGDPNTMLAIQAGGAGYSAAGSFYSSLASKTEAKAQASIDMVNAHLAENNAQAALREGQTEAQQQQLKTAATKGTQIASMAANGIDSSVVDSSGTNSALQAQNSTDVMGQISVNNIERNAIREAWGFRTEATSFQNKARSETATAKATNPLMSTASSLIGSATKIAASAYAANKATGSPTSNKSITVGNMASAVKGASSTPLVPQSSLQDFNLRGSAISDG